MLYTIVYKSYPKDSLREQDLHDILESAQNNNEKAGITGMLLYASSTFVQILEGEEEAVKKLYALIEEDSRHKEPIILYEGGLETRAFSSWKMAFKKLSDKEYAAFTDHINLDDPQLNNNLAALTILEAFQGFLD